MENQQMNPQDRMMAMFEVANNSAQASTSAFGPKSSTTNVLRINMNSKDNQGTIIFIPISDLMYNPFICSIVHEVTAVWKGQDGQANNRVRQLLEKPWYGQLTPEQDAKYDELLANFNSLYQNREMLAATDWAGYVTKNKYFGFYGWVIQHNDINGNIRKDKEGVPHNGKSGEGRLAYIQFKSTGFINAWDSFMKQKAAMKLAPQQWVPQVFSRNEFRPIALSITYNQDSNNKFTGSIVEQWFQTQLVQFINDPAANQTAYHLPIDKLADAKDLAKELINTDIEGSLFEDQSINQFERACRAVFNSFDYYKKHGQKAYEIYSNEFKYNEVDQNVLDQAAPQTTTPPATVAIDQAVQAAQGGNPLTGGIPTMQPGQAAPVIPGQPTYAMPGQMPPVVPQGNTTIVDTPTGPQELPFGQSGPAVPPVTPPPSFAQGQQPQAPQWGVGAPVMPGQQPMMPGQPQAPVIPGQPQQGQQ